MIDREEFKKGIIKQVNKYAPLNPKDKEDLIESYMLVYDSRQNEIDELKSQIQKLKENLEKLRGYFGWFS